MTIDDVKEFLRFSSISSENTYEAFEFLLKKLETKSTRKKARSFLSELIKASSKSENTNFHFFKMDISSEEKEDLLTLLQLPSTFAPEDWSYTFFEGLSRYPLNEFNHKKMVELGCGNGWITIAMAKRYNLQKIFGLDINPKAILSSRLNLFINALDDEGSPIKNEYGSKLIDLVEFQESDLYEYFFQNEIKDFDAIIGCIPQVLIPSKENIEDTLSSGADDDFLYSLSNYTEEQGYIEDQFGLGLIARTLEEGLELIASGGKFILNLGGRPGEHTLVRMFKRRGFNVNKIWERKVSQAGDTEIEPLIELEEEIGHRFEFYTAKDSEFAINAQTAKAYINNGGKIFHKLSVFEGKPAFQDETIQLFKTLNKDEYGTAKSNLDLDYNNHDKREEKVQFLAQLSEELEKTSHFPYASTQGELRFRKAISGFINAYYYASISEESVLVAPSVNALIKNLICTFKPQSIFLPKERYDVFNKLYPGCIDVPAFTYELNQLVKSIQPQIVIAKVDPEILVPIERLEQLIEITENTKSRLIIDISEIFEISSQPGKNEVLKLLTKSSFPKHVTIVAELSKNQVYRTLSCCFAVSQNQNMIDSLVNMAEFTYSRSPLVSQLYYSSLMEHLLQFQMSKVRGIKGDQVNYVETNSFKQYFIQPNENVIKAFGHPAITGNSYPIKEDTIRLDYGENELPTPLSFKAHLLEAFSKQHFTYSDKNPRPEIKEFLRRRFNYSVSQDRNIILGNGVAPLFTAVVEACQKEGGTLILPQGSYGYFDATIQAFSLSTEVLQTRSENDFKIDKIQLKETLKLTSNPWLFLNFPLVNPTGAQYTNEEIKDLFDSIDTPVTIVFDTVFSGLEHSKDIEYDFFKNLNSHITPILIGGISKEYAAGGIRFGYLTTVQKLNQIKEFVIDEPHYTISYTIKKTLRGHLENTDSIVKELAKQRRTLKNNAQKLTKVLESIGWTVLTPQGGLFLVAKPPKNKSNQDLTEICYNKVNILINNANWTGIPEYCRFVLSIEPKLFSKALSRLENLKL